SFGEEIKATYLAKAGISYGINMLRHDNNDFDSLSEEWAKTIDKPFSFSLGEGTVEISIVDEDSKLLFDEKMKDESGEERRMQAERLFEYLKVDTTMNSIRDKIPFLTSAELLLAAGPELNDYGTVRSSGLININTAKEAILKSLEIYASLDGLAEKVLEYREKNPFKTSEEVQSGLGDNYYKPIQGLITTESHFFSIVSKAVLGDNKKTVRAVVKRDKDSIKTLYWRLEN
ncbi:MAG: general secretion pathway protein GspK, partial [Candidatus Omnitrophica bacterium]|nr:general secretion pathway protein GspK [Candidatus Omnitrophota bacterium]